MIGSLAGIGLGLRLWHPRNSKLETRNECAEGAEWRDSLEFAPHDQIGSS
jgi:hypothetical protein